MYNYRGETVMEEYSIVDALVELKPGAEWSIGGRDYEQLVWLDKSQTKPTLDELNTKLSEMNAAEPMKQLRVIRNQKLAETDWTQNADVPNSTKTKWTSYRQALRDLPASSTPKLGTDNLLDMSSVTWPTKPS